MTDRILCAVDLTHEDDARKILKRAGQLAGWEGAALSLVTVLPDYGSSFVGSFFQEGLLSEAAEAARVALHGLADEVLPDHGEVQCIVEIGTAYEKVLEAAEMCKADLIVVGAHRPGFRDRVIGPNAARVVRHAQVSVLVVRV